MHTLWLHYIGYPTILARRFKEKNISLFFFIEFSIDLIFHTPFSFNQKELSQTHLSQDR